MKSKKFPTEIRVARDPGDATGCLFFGVMFDGDLPIDESEEGIPVATYRLVETGTLKLRREYTPKKSRGKKAKKS